MKMFLRTSFYLILVFVLSKCSVDIPKEVALEIESLPESIDFNYHVKPILSDRCYACHGPDAKTRKAGLRLDVESVAFSKKRLAMWNSPS